MRGVILAAGEGSRMGPYTDDVPKSFLELEGETLYDRQQALLEPHVEGTTVVLGYQHEVVCDRFDLEDPLVLEGWDRYENAASLRLALQHVDDDVLVCNGDVLVDERALARLVETFAVLQDRTNVVGCIPGMQDEETAIRWNERGRVTGYGLIRGHQHAGVGIVSRANREVAIDGLGDRLTDWYPHVYLLTPTRPVLVPAERHVEINRPQDLREARTWLASPRVSQPSST